jgi:hypothetical protein
MVDSSYFKINVQHSGVGAMLKSPGRITFVIAALEAYELAKQRRLPALEQLSYLYEVAKQCKKWLGLKNDKKTAKALSRWVHVNGLLNDVYIEMAARFPDIWNALITFEQRKATPLAGPTRAAQGVYAHETAVYRSTKAAAGFAVGAQRMTASATLMNNGNHLHRMGASGHPAHNEWMKSPLRPAEAKGLRFAELNETQFRELDRLLLGQQNVLYMSKIQRLEHMVIIDNGLMKRPNGSLITLLRGETLLEELNRSAYAMDKYGNLFVTTQTHHAGTQINHTTLCAGNEVICAGTMSIKAGVLKIITNNSGHYTPTTANLQRVMRVLEESGVPMFAVVAIDHSQGGGLEVAAREFLQGTFRAIPAHISRSLFAKTA